MRITLSPTATLFHADCRATLASLPDNSVDSVCTDPPYALTQASRNGSPRNNDPETPFGRTKLGERGFMGKTWDTGEVAFDHVFWAEVLRVLKPGGHLAAFSASRTYHRMACAIEDAGFEIRDSLMWVYGTGFPKSQDVSKFIDKMAGAERQIIGQRVFANGTKPRATARNFGVGDLDERSATHGMQTAPATPAAAEWEGFGTALKPAFEPIVLARKPLSEGTVAANVLRWRTGALNIDGCRINSWTEADLANMAVSSRGDSGNASTNFAFKGSATPLDASKGRWPANVCHDGSDEVIAAFPGDGSAARFFYSAKASKADRNGSKHPTVKPIALMQWLARLITPPGGTVLDPFAGSGTTGAACAAEGFTALLCEREDEYVADIRRRFGPAPALVVSLEAIRAEIEAAALLRSWVAARA